MTSLPFSPCPEAGAGAHTWLAGAARRCQRAGLSAADAVALLTEHLTRDPSPADEVEATVANIYGSEPGNAAAPKWPARNWSKIAEIARGGMTAAALADASPDRLPEDGTAEALRHLFAGEALICCGERLHAPMVKTREEWEATGVLSRLQFVVPSPMLGLSGLTQGPNAHESPRALSNVGPRKWLVAECDFAAEDVTRAGASSSHDLCAGVLAHLADFGRLVMVVHSGGKSLHGWFAVDRDEDELRRFMAYAVSIGADPKTWTPNQIVRMPGGTREGGARQTVLYWNERRATQWA